MKHNIKTYLFCFLITFQLSELFAFQRSKQEQKLQATIDSLLSDSMFAPCFIGLKIVSLTDGNIIYSENSNKLFHPASNMKLLTTATALYSLDSNYKFTTRISYQGKILQGVLKGDISIKGIGDPLFSVEDLDSLVEKISQSVTKKIEGNIIGDGTVMDDIYWGEGWMWDDEPEYYEAFISPLTINGNYVTVRVSPGMKSGEQLNISIEPQTEFLTIKNEGITSNDTTIPLVLATRPKRENTIIVKGRMSTTDTIKKFEISVWRPELWFLDLLKEKLIKRGIEVQGKCILDTVQNRNEVFSISHSLDSILHFINKPSDNLAAELLLKTIGKEQFGEPGTAEKGLKAVLEYLSSIGIDTSLLILADGSGLSFYNQVSPDAIVKILEAQYKSKTFKRFYESLPAAGIDGTLKNRLKGTKAEGNLHAKTGSISSVSTLSGYITTADAETLAFSFMSNHYPKEHRDIRKLQDTIMDILSNSNLKEK